MESSCCSLPHSHESTYLSLSWGRLMQSMTPSNVLKVRFNVILPSTCSYPKSSLSARFLHQNPVCSSLLPRTCYIPPQSQCSWNDRLNNIWRGVQIIKILSALVSDTSSQCSLFSMRGQISHPYKTIGKFIILCILIFVFLSSISWFHSALYFFMNAISFARVVPKYLNCSTLSSGLLPVNFFIVTRLKHRHSV
jgi:hypothetical protein